MRKFMARHRAISFVLGVVLAMATGAAAAWIVYTGISGAPSGNFGSQTNTASALVVSNDGPAPAINAGETKDIPVKVTNVSSVTETVTNGGGISLTGVPDECQAALHMLGMDSGLISTGTVYTPGQVRNGNIQLSLDQNAPLSCRNGNWTATFTGGTTNP